MVNLSFLTEEARDRAKQYRESRYEDERSKNDRRSLVFGSLDDVLSETHHHGLELKTSDSERVGGSLHTSSRSQPSTPTSSKRRYQRRSSCTIYNLATAAQPTSSNETEEITESHRQTWSKPRSRSLSHRSKYQDSTEDSSQQQHEPRTIDERPIPLRNSSHHNRQSLISSSHHRPHDHDELFKSPKQHKHTMDLNEDNSVSMVSFGDEDDPASTLHASPNRNMITIDQRPLPLKEINVGAPTTPSSHKERRPIQTYGSRSAPTTRRPWLPKSPGSLSKQTTTRRSSSSSKSSKLLGSPSAKRNSSSSRNDDKPASPEFIPPSPMELDENKSPRGTQHSRRIGPSPPAKKLKSPSSRTTTPTSSSRAARRNSSSSRRKTKGGALPSSLPLSSDHECGNNNNKEFDFRTDHRAAVVSPGRTRSPGKNKKRSLSKKRAPAAKGIDLDDFFGNN